MDSTSVDNNTVLAHNIAQSAIVALCTICSGCPYVRDVLQWDPPSIKGKSIEELIETFMVMKYSLYDSVNDNLISKTLVKKKTIQKMFDICRMAEIDLDYINNRREDSPAAGSQLAELTEKVNYLETTKSILKKQFKQIQITNILRCKEIDAVHAQVNKLSAEKDIYKDELDSLVHGQKNMQVLIDNLNEKNARLQDENDELNAKVAMLSCLKVSLFSKIESLTEENKTIKAEVNSALVDENNTLKVDIASLQTAKERLIEGNYTIVNKFDNLSHENLALKQERDTYIAEIKSLTLDNDEYKECNTLLQKEVSRLETEVNNYTTKIEIVKASYGYIRQKLTTAQSQNEEIQKLIEENNKQKEEIEKLVGVNENVFYMYNHLIACIPELTAQIETLKTKTM